MLKEPKEFQYLTLPNSEWWNGVLQEMEENPSTQCNLVIEEIRKLHVAYIEAWHALQEKESGVVRGAGHFDKVIRQAERMSKGRPMGD